MLACSIRCFEHLVVSNRSGLLCRKTLHKAFCVVNFVGGTKMAELAVYEGNPFIFVFWGTCGMF